MGQDMPSKTGNTPSFLVQAQADSGGLDVAPGNHLQRVQIIKGWIGDDGNNHQKVYDVAGNSNNGASVNIDTCEPTGTGYRSLCSVWKDPEFDESKRAVYYARAVENPSCRYSQYDCTSVPEDQHPSACYDPFYAKTIQERAWSTPIWISSIRTEQVAEPLNYSAVV